MNIAVIGTGHVGLPTAAALAHLGHRVAATDADHEKLRQLASGTTPFFEPGLDELVADGLSSGKLSFAAELGPVLQEAEVAFICVGTPPRASGEANLVAVEQAARAVAESAAGPLVVVEKSTVPAGTAERMAETLRRWNLSGRFEVVSNPEFLREGSAVHDSLHPPRVLVGSDSAHALETMRRVYRPLVERGTEFIETDLRTAELAKHACNAFLAMKVSFINALARVCELAGADVAHVADVMGSDPRIGRAFLNAGIGYGGYCFPKDLAAFERLTARLGYDFSLLREVARINEEALDSVFQKIESVLWNLEGKRVALLGLSFKPGTSDTRLAPALALARRLLDEGSEVVGFDPAAGASAKAEVPNLEVSGDAYAALEGAHCAVLCTEWDEFRDLDLARVRSIMTFPIVVDGRNLFDPKEMSEAGFTYVATGRPGAGSGAR